MRHTTRLAMCSSWPLVAAGIALASVEQFSLSGSDADGYLATIGLNQEGNQTLQGIDRDPANAKLFDYPAYVNPSVPSNIFIYAYNGRMLGVPGEEFGPARWIGFRVSQLKTSPSRTILVTDAGDYDSGYPGNVVFNLEFELQPPVRDPYMPRGRFGSSPTSEEANVHGRHGGDANVLWADMSVDRRPVRLEESMPWESEVLLGDVFDGDEANNDYWDAGFR